MHRQLVGQLAVAVKGIEVNIWQIKSPVWEAFVDVQILTQGTCKPTGAVVLVRNGFAALLAQFIRVAFFCDVVGPCVF